MSVHSFIIFVNCSWVSNSPLSRAVLIILNNTKLKFSLKENPWLLVTKPSAIFFLAFSKK